MLNKSLTATGAWFTSNANGDAGSGNLNFGKVEIAIDNDEGVKLVRETNCATLVVDGCSWTPTVAYENKSTVGILYTVAYEIKVEKQVNGSGNFVEVSETEKGYFTGIVSQAASLKSAKANATADTIDLAKIVFNSNNALNGSLDIYRITVTLEVKAMQAEHATIAAVQEQLGLTVDQTALDAAIAAAK